MAMLWSPLWLLRTSLSPPSGPSAPDEKPLFIGLRPLVGGPSFLPLHVEVAAHDLVFDFLPENPTAGSTTAALALGQGVAGSIRVRPLRSECKPPRWRLIGYTSRPAEELSAHANSQPSELRLLDNNCWTFAASLTRYAVGSGAPGEMRDGEGIGG